MLINFANEGRLGNKMFAFAFSYLLARSLDLRLMSLPIPEFKTTKLMAAYTGGRVILGDTIAVVEETDELFGEIVERCAGKTVYVRGWFERAEFYLHHQAVLDGIFDHRDTASYDYVFHFRGNDFIAHGKETPASFYIDAWQELGKPKNVLICTDDLNCPSLVEFCKVSGIRRPDTIREAMFDFNLMRNAKHLVISRSTFAWWAAFLSFAKVIQPQQVENNPNRNLIVPNWTQIKV